MGQAKLVSFFWADMWSHVLITLMLIWMTSCCASKTAQKIDIQAVVCPQLCTSSIHLSVTPHPSSPSNSYPTVIQILHITQTMLFLSLCLRVTQIKKTAFQVWVQIQVKMVPFPLLTIPPPSPSRGPQD